MSDKEGLKF